MHSVVTAIALNLPGYLYNSKPHNILADCFVFADIAIEIVFVVFLFEKSNKIVKISLHVSKERVICQDSFGKICQTVTLKNDLLCQLNTNLNTCVQFSISENLFNRTNY